MTVSEQELTSLAATHDIISLGMLADDAAPAAPRRCAPHSSASPTLRPTRVRRWRSRRRAGEVRIVGAPASRAAAVDARAARSMAAGAGAVPVSGVLAGGSRSSWPARDGVTLRALLEELRAAGLELVAEAPFDRLQDPRRSIEEVNIAGLALARLTVISLPSPDRLPLLKAVAELQRAVAVIRAFAPLPRRMNSAVPTHRLRRREARGARAGRRRQRAVDSGGLVALRPQARAGGAHGRRRRCGRACRPEDETTEGRRRAPLEEIRRNIRAAGQEPVERNGRFESCVARSDARSERRPVRLGAVGYLNARPLVYGLERSPRFDLRYDVPSECARLLHAGAIDVGLIPSIEYLRGERRTAIVPDLAIASRGPVASVALYTTRPIADVRSIALDTSSRTSVALVTRAVRAALQDSAGARVARSGSGGRCSAHCDAALHDRRQRAAARSRELRAADRRRRAALAPARLEKIDLGEVWTTMTGLPFV